MKAVPIVCFTLAVCTPCSADAPERLTLPDALARALDASPEIRAAAGTMRVREALSVQAGALPNPELEAEVENVGGSGSRERFEQTETTVRVAQRIELGGKRAARKRAAASEQGLAHWDFEAARVTVVVGTTKAFVSALAAQHRLALAIETERLVEDTAEAVRRSVSAGASAPVDATRARISVVRARVEREQAERAVEGALALLASTWGADRVDFERVAGDLEAPGTLPSEAELRPALDRNPALARWRSERDGRTAALALERTRRIPDVTLGAGGRHFSDNGDNALVFLVSVPLPVFDRNAGAIRAARERLEQAADEEAAARAEARTALRDAYVRLTGAHALAIALRTDVLPDARRALRDTLDAFRSGVLRPLDVIDARRALVEVESERIDALEAFHLAAADIEALTGTALAAGERPDGGAGR